MAGTAALNEKLSNGGDLGSLYNQAYAVYGGAQDRFRQESPGTALATDLAGSIPTTIAATAASGAGLGVAGNTLLDAVNGFRAAAPLAAAGNFLTGAARGRLRCSGPGNSPCLSRRGCGRVRRGDQHGAHAAAHDGFRALFGCGKPSVKADSPVRAAASPGQEAIESRPSRQHEGDGSDDPCERYKNLCPEHAFPSARHGRDASGAELRRDRDPGRVLRVAGRAAAARTSRAA